MMILQVLLHIHRPVVNTDFSCFGLPDLLFRLWQWCRRCARGLGWLPDVDWQVIFDSTIQSLFYTSVRFFYLWQTSQEIEEEILIGKTSLRLREGTTQKEVKRMRTDVWSGMFFSNLVMYFIIVTCAATLYLHGVTNITTAEDAAKALRPVAG